MDARSQVQAGAKTLGHSPLSAPREMLLQRMCACGLHSVGGECGECSKKRFSEKASGAGMVQRRAAGNQNPKEVPKSVHDVLRSPGRPLDATTLALFEPRFGRDSSRVRAHTDV